MPMIAKARFETAHGSKYLQQLCKHFAHKLAVEFDECAGRIALPTGPAVLNASQAALSITITADDAAGVIRARQIIDDHLRRFAFREGFDTMDWQPA